VSIESETRRPSRSVLVVDDDPAVHDAIQVELEELFQVHHAQDAATALRVIGAEPIDVLLLDILMPRTDGLEILARVRKLKPQLPVIVVTALDKAAVATESLRLGARDCITKPFEPEALVLSLMAVLAPPSRPRRHPAAPPSSHQPRGHRHPRPVLLVGRDVSAMATLKAALGTPATEVLSSVSAALQQCDDRQPALTVIDDSIDLDGVLNVVNVVRSTVKDCRLLVGFGPGRSALDLRELMALQPDALIRKPYDLNEVRLWARLAAEDDTAVSVGSLSPPLVKALWYVHSDYRTAGVAAAARASHVSKSRLAHLFATELGVTFWSHVIRVRVEIAKSLLADTPDKLEHIAKLTGFCDAPHLSRVFLRCFGQSPGAFRRKSAERRHRTAAPHPSAKVQKNRPPVH
jgi:CheY-like chemotaxis protein/AraC-like DNA-binding protein